MSGFHHATAERRGILQAYFKWWDTTPTGKEERTFDDLSDVLKHATVQGWELVGTTFSDAAGIHYLFFKKPLP